MTRKLVLLFTVTALAFSGCKKVQLPFIGKKEQEQPKTEEVATAAPPATGAKPEAPSAPDIISAEPSSPSAPAQVAVDTKAEVVVLCYHRIEGKAGGALSIEPALFEQQMQAIKDAGVAVISMQDFLAWRRGEKSIPAKSVLITIDDGYLSAYNVAWPILKKFNYPFTMFVYLNYISKGGKSMTWEQLAEMRDAGVEIGSHTISHQDLRRKPSKVAGEYEPWLREELGRSKQEIEERLGIRAATLAYPFGLHNEKVHAAVRELGYEAAFTTYGQRLGHNAPAYSLGRYDVTAKDVHGTDAFTIATSFTGMLASGGEQVLAQDAAASMITQPMNGETITETKPTIKANLATMGTLDEGSVEMRISGVGLVKPQFDTSTKMLTYVTQQPLRPGNYRVIINAKSGGRKVETGWNFKVAAPGGAPSGAAETVPPAPPTAGR